MADQPKTNAVSDDEASEATYGVSPAEELTEISADYLAHNLAKVGGNPIVNAGESVAKATVIKPSDLAKSINPKK